MTGFPWTRIWHHFMPNIGTILVVALMLMTYQTWAAPLAQTPDGTSPAAEVGSESAPEGEVPMGQALGVVTSGTLSGIVSYQGEVRKADLAATPVDGTLGMTFRLYSTPTGGSALWTEAHTGSNAVPVENGLFHVFLGSLTPISSTVWNQSALYLGVQVAGEAEMSPREVVGGVPMAMTVPDRSLSLAKLGLAKYNFWRDGNSIRYSGPTGQETTLDLSTCSSEVCCDAANTICYFHNGVDESILEFSLQGASSISCLLVHSEDDIPLHNQGLVYATDGGNTTYIGVPAARLSKAATTGIPLAVNASYYWLCGW